MVTRRAARAAGLRPRRKDYSDATRAALIDSAVRLFTERGYAQTSTDEIARAARVTKGALYHHFHGKPELFEAAFAAVQDRVFGSLSAITSRPGDVWQATLDGLGEYVQICLDPAYRRIVVQEGPAVLGWRRWYEAEEKHGLGVVRDTLSRLIDAGEIVPLPVEVLARLVVGGLSAAAGQISASEEPERVSAEAAEVIAHVMNGLRAAKA